MIVRKSKHPDLLLHEVTASLHPLLQILRPVHNRLIPSLRHFLNPLAVSQPPDINEIGGDGVAAGQPPARPRHTWMIDQRQTGIVVPQQVTERRADAVYVADF